MMLRTAKPATASRYHPAPSSAINLLTEFIIPTEDLPDKERSHKIPFFQTASEIR